MRGLPVQRVPALLNPNDNDVQLLNSKWTLTGSTGVPPLPVRPRSSALTDLSPGWARFEAFAVLVVAKTDIVQKQDGIRLGVRAPGCVQINL